MQLLFIADPLESFKTTKDTTFAMMREAQRRGHTIAACEPQDVMWERGGPVMAHVRDIVLTGHADGWFSVRQERAVALAGFDAVLMRKDPPFDSEYFYATHLLEQAERDGARVFNKPRALRDHPEKLAIMEFPQFIGPTLVTRDARDIQRFHAEHRDIILKPLDGMGGMGIFRVGPDGLNLGSITETLNRGGAQSLMVQKFLPEIAEGDKRVLIIGGKPVPFCLARIPQGSEVRGNLAAGGKGVARPLSERDFEIAHALGPILQSRGLLLAGVDVIGDCVTEINVTSPTCFQEIQQQTGCDVPALFIDALESAVNVSVG
ncbi:MAG TPA: glutathione synthase [Comamonadaceae bacterium]|nr:glutathione synthase [Burkholderiaceae bacterium]OGB45916.1 MAG: glutathione synthase [Burkholderiales bacterium RIFCSPLOWO2_12_FULL_65_40]HCE29975.1 glutathione synthase [Comamonadaceae bacterium]